MQLKKEVFFSFSAFEESGMLESDEVFGIYCKAGVFFFWFESVQNMGKSQLVLGSIFWA